MESLINKNRILLDIEACDWREAIRLAGDLLVRDGCISDLYTESMMRAVEELGPYMVILPGFALAHAAPSPAVYSDAMSLVTLHTPVSFGSSENDPVRVVLCLSCVDRESHIAALQRVAIALMEDGAVDRLANAASAEEVLELLAQEPAN
ncbi:Ascorbate-specific PTS system EIIA component [bioreactor metagenome]|jgi:PTS system ascorbate-specific IIA component|uniref:Ascorbate-specific PTS system EIIA component n=1 Tax=bioreactor metagenome TaxID=1076179 RepID=A0A645BH66_9ZZZZ